jgi:glucose-1-phosphate adenylyltransferase
MHNVLSLIMGGGRGTRLYPLTLHRSKPAVPIAGKYRLIDVPISNCINSQINRVYVLTQFMSASLHRHISNTYKFDAFDNGFVEILAAQQTNEAADWYQGTADAVRQNIPFFRDDRPEMILVLSGDQLYRMDYRELLRTHRESHADVTIAVLPVRKDQTPGFGLVQLNEHGRVTGFIEKPKKAEQLEPFVTPAEWLRSRGIASSERPYLASMGIYLFNAQALLDLLYQPPLAADFGREIFPRSIRTHHVQAHLFDGYWEDLGTIKAYHEASLGLAQDPPTFDFYSPGGFMFTRMRFLPASRISAARLEQCLVSDGCIIEAGAQIERSIIGLRSRIGRDVAIRESVITGADHYQSEAAMENGDTVPLGIGAGSIIERAIVDKDCRIGSNVRIVNRAGVQEADHHQPDYVIRDGIVVVPKATTIPDGTTI